jgi:hypothetical protein
MRHGHESARVGRRGVSQGSYPHWITRSTREQ